MTSSPKPTGQTLTGPQWVNAIRDAGVDAAAITDHNTAAGIAELKEAARRA